MPTSRRWKRSTRVILVTAVISLATFYAFREDGSGAPRLRTPFRTVTTTVTRYISITNVLTAAPAPSTKPRLEKHTYRPDGLLEVNHNGPHPIFELVRRAEREWEEKLKRASKTLVDAVKEYQRRYKRDPPKGFDLWCVINFGDISHLIDIVQVGIRDGTRCSTTR